MLKIIKIVFLLFFLSLLFFPKATINASQTEETSPPYYVFPHPEYNTYPVGLFAVFCMCLGILDQYENSQWAGFEVNFANRGLYYDPNYGENWWNYYFAPIKLGWSNKNNIKIISPEQAIQLGAQIAANPRERVAELVKKYIHVKPPIISKVKGFIKKFSSPFVIGIHYRGTDKILEVRKVPYPYIYDKINEIISTLDSDFQVFVATDEQAFLDDISQIYPGKILATEAYRSLNGLPVHYGNNLNQYKKGEQALVDCLILSKCHLLIRTPSTTLSLASSYFNPDLPVITIPITSLP